jgi:ligand-binding sensor domain-containing protein/signal transduction histidine kinase
MTDLFQSAWKHTGLGRSLLLVIICLEALPGARAVEKVVVQDVVLRNWDLDDGLPSTRVNAVARTPDGYLWLATQRGLVRFDGARFTTVEITNIPSSQTRRATALLVDGKKSFWVGVNGQLLRQAGPGFVTVDVQKATAGRRLNAIAEDAQGALWLATDGAGLARIRDDKLDSVVAASGLPSTNVSEVLCDPAGRMWAVAGGRLVTFENNRWHEPEGSPAPPEMVQAVARARDGGLWVLTTEPGPVGNHHTRLHKLREAAWSTELAPYPWAQASVQVHGSTVLEDAGGRVWCATAGGVFFHSPAGSWQRLVTVSPWVQVEALCLEADESGALWIGTRTTGLLHVQQRPVQTLALPAAVSQHPVLTVCLAHDGSVWGGTDGAGIFRWANDALTQYGVEYGLTDLHVAALLEDRRTNLWVGTFAGLFRRAEDRFEPVPGHAAVREPILALLEDRSGDIWAGGQTGLIRIRTDGTDFFGSDEGLTAGPIRALGEDGGGQMWVGAGRSGLFCQEGRRFRRVATPTRPVAWAVRALHHDAAGDLWIATDYSGLLRLHNGSFDHWDWSRDGLPSNFILGIAEDANGNLWMSSENGVFGCSKQALLAARPSGTRRLQPWRLTTAEGLSHKVCSGIGQPAVVRSTDGRLWIPNGPAIAAFDPAKVSRAVRIWPPVVESVRVDGTPLPISSAGLRVRSGARQIEFQYTSPNVVLPERLRFRIRMDGLDRDWMDAGTRREITYYRPPPGDYEFHVTACGPENQWTEGSGLRLEIVPRFWERRSAQLTGGLGLLALVGGAVWRWERNRSRRHLERLEMQRNLERERTRIARDIHDDLGASLTHITMLTQSARSRPDRSLEPGGELDQIFGTARELTRSMEEVVWAVSPTHDSLDSLANYLGIYAQDFAAASGLRCRLDLPAQLSQRPLSSQTRHNVFLAFKEALHNVAKHAAASEVRVSLGIEAGNFVLTVEDNGRGCREFASPAAPAAEESERASRLLAGHGLASMRSRLEEIGGQCQIHSTYGLGTHVRFIIPFVT